MHDKRPITPEMELPSERNQSDSIIAIVKTIKWPTIISALKNAFYCLIASAAICCLLLGYHSIINHIVASIF